MDTLRIGLIGVGGFARIVSQPASSAEARVVSMPTRAPSDRPTKAKHPSHRDAKEYSDFRELIAQVGLMRCDSDSPHSARRSNPRCLRGGMHACTEKPMVTSVKDAERVIAARDKAGKVGMVSYQRHFQPNIVHPKPGVEWGSWEGHLCAGFALPGLAAAHEGLLRQDSCPLRCGHSTTAEAISSMSCSGHWPQDGERASDLRQSRFAGGHRQFPHDPVSSGAIGALSIIETPRVGTRRHYLLQESRLLPPLRQADDPRSGRQQA